MSYSHIIFDFGNVLIDLDIDGCYSRMESLMCIDTNTDEYTKTLMPILEKYERGEISDETLIWNFQQFNDQANPRLFVDAWNSMLLSINPDVIKMLIKLRQAYNLSLLSNINGFHARKIKRYLKNEFDIVDFTTKYFDQYYYSHEVGMRKPESRIYNYVSQDLEVKNLKEVLFIDDNEQNIAAAKAHGWSTKLHNPSTLITSMIDEYLF